MFTLVNQIFDTRIETYPLFFVYIDITELQNFVDDSVASDARWEDDLMRDKLSNLYVVGSGFGPLIYKLPRTADCLDLQERCAVLWDALKDTPDLPERMVS